MPQRPSAWWNSRASSRGSSAWNRRAARTASASPCRTGRARRPSAPGAGTRSTPPPANRGAPAGMRTSRSVWRGSNAPTVGTPAAASTANDAILAAATAVRARRHGARVAPGSRGNRPRGAARGVSTAMCPSRVAEGEERGWIVPIGGAEDKEMRRRILKRFVQLCGGRDADIAIIPTASKLPDTGPRYEELFGRLEAGRARSIGFASREDGQRDDYLRQLETATGVFFTGGNQLRISTIIGGTPAAKLIRERNARGVHVGGTSAGASILSDHMIAFGKEGSSPRAGSVRLAPGLG